MGNPFSYCMSTCFPTRAALKNQELSLKHFESGADFVHKQIAKEQKELDLLMNQRSLIATRIMSLGNKALQDPNLVFNLKQLFHNISLKKQLISQHYSKIEMVNANSTRLQNDYTNTVFFKSHGEALKYAEAATLTLGRRTKDVNKQVQSSYALGAKLDAFDAAVEAGTDLIKPDFVASDQNEKLLKDALGEEVQLFITECLLQSAGPVRDDILPRDAAAPAPVPISSIALPDPVLSDELEMN